MRAANDADSLKHFDYYGMIALQTGPSSPTGYQLRSSGNSSVLRPISLLFIGRRPSSSSTPFGCTILGQTAQLSSSGARRYNCILRAIASGFRKTYHPQPLRCKGSPGENGHDHGLAPVQAVLKSDRKQRVEPSEMSETTAEAWHKHTTAPPHQRP